MLDSLTVQAITPYTTKPQKGQKTILLIGLVDLAHPSKGDSKHFSLLVTYLSQLFKVYTITLSNTEPSTDQNFYLRYPKNNLLRNIYWNRKCFSLIKQIKQIEKIDLVYSRAQNLFGIYFTATYFKLKLGVEINGMIVHDFSSKILTYLELKLYQYLFTKVDFFTASKGYIQYIIDYFAVQPQKTVPLNLGHTGQIMNCSKEIARTKLALDLDKQYFLFIGNVIEYQGLALLLEVANIYQEAFRKQQFCFLIVGDGPSKRTLQAYALQYQLTDLIEFRNPVQGVAFEYYLNIDAIGLSPLSPNKGGKGSRATLKTFDYFFHRMPILTSFIDEMGDFITANGFGYSIQDYSSTEVYKLLLLLHLEKEAIKSRYEVQFEQKIASFTWDNRFKKIAEQIQDLS